MSAATSVTAPTYSHEVEALCEVLARIHYRLVYVERQTIPALSAPSTAPSAPRRQYTAVGPTRAARRRVQPPRKS